MKDRRHVRALITGVVATLSLLQLPPAVAVSDDVVISEFATRSIGSTQDEFVELYNRSVTPVDVTGWTLRHSGSTGVTSTMMTIGSSEQPVTIPPHEHLLLGNPLFTGTADYIWTGGGVGEAGGFAIYDDGGLQVDAVATSSGSAYIEGSALPEFPGTGSPSYERKPGGSDGNGQDTDDNSQDFQLLVTRAPNDSGDAPTPAPNPLSVTTSGTGTGSVTSSPSGIDCPPTCDANFPSGAPVSLTALPAAGSVFTGWNGACTGTSACNILMSQPRDVTATFVPMRRRPDGLVKLSTDGKYIGNNVYNLTASGQTRSTSARRTRSKTFVVRVQNDGNTTDSFRIKGPGSSSGFTVKYLRGTTNVTSLVVGGTLKLSSLAPAAVRTFKVVVKVGKGAKIGAVKGVLVVATSLANSSKDAVKGKVKVIR